MVTEGKGLSRTIGQNGPAGRRVTRNHFSFAPCLVLQLKSVPIVLPLQNLVQKLVALHKNVYKEIEHLYNPDHHQPASSIKQLTRAIEALVR